MATEAASRVALTDHLRNSITEALGNHIIGANLRDDGTLVILASGPEWATRLRYESDRILALSRQLQPGAARVRIRVSQGD